MSRMKVGGILLSVVVIFVSCMTTVASKKQVEKTGKDIFESNCVTCHGSDGTKGRWGAKNLKASTLADEDLFRTISNGRRIMPAWKNKLTSNEIVLVIDYVKTLRQ